MEQRELVAEIASESGLSRAGAQRALKAIFDTITAAMVEGQTVSIQNFGSFRRRYRAEVGGRNPLTGEVVRVPAEIRAIYRTTGGMSRKLNAETERPPARSSRRAARQSFPDDLQDDTTVPEGAKKRVVVNKYERDPRARRKCLGKFGHVCVVCRFDFAAVYGPLGKEYIHVHHLRDLATVGENYEVDPIKDLRPVCPNCHAMLHRKGAPAMAIADLRALLSQRNASLPLRP